jgi:hypothetical protein
MLQFQKSESVLRRRGAPCSLFVLALGALACSDDSSDIAAKVGKVTDSCALNSDCASPLVCVFERCHEPCNADSDCPYPARCVQSDRTNVFACQFPDEAACSGGDDSDCNAPLVCAEDDQCRSPCRNDAECPDEQSCTSGGVCAGEREVGDDGELLTSEPADPGSLGDEDDDSDTAPDDAGSEVEPPSEEEPEPNAEERPDASMDLGEEPVAVDAGLQSEDEHDDVSDPLDGGSDPSEVETDAMSSVPEEPEPEVESNFDYVEEEGMLEPMPNETREDALPLTTASIWLEGSDVDWFYVDVPDDGRAQIIELTQTQSVDLISSIGVVAGADFSPIGTAYNAIRGTNRTLYATVGSGTRTLFSFAATNRGFGRSDITVSVTPENDEYEPNPSRDEAAPIALNTDITAQLIVPYVSTSDRSADDYYQVELAEGSAIFRLLSTPSNLRYRVRLLPIGEGATQTVANTTVGDTGSWEFDVPTAGAYAVSVEDLEQVGAYFQSLEPHLVESYSFRVEQ